MEPIRTPFFSAQFEALRQYDILRNTENTATDVVTLASNPTASLMHLAVRLVLRYIFRMYTAFGAMGMTLFPIEDLFSASLLHKLHRVGDVELNMLSLLEMELPILGQNIAQGTALLCRDQLLDMNMHLLSIGQSKLFVLMTTILLWQSKNWHDN